VRDGAPSKAPPDGGGKTTKGWEELQERKKNINHSNMKETLSKGRGEFAQRTNRNEKKKIEKRQAKRGVLL